MKKSALLYAALMSTAVSHAKVPTNCFEPLGDNMNNVLSIKPPINSFLGCNDSFNNNNFVGVSSCGATISLSSGSASTTVCINMPITNILYTIGGDATGAILSNGTLPTGLTGSFFGGIFIISGTPTESGVFPYTITTIGASCNNPSLSGTITITGDASLTLSSGSPNINVCVNQTITNIIYSIGGSATGAVLSTGNLPPGITGIYNGGNYTISGVAAIPGIFPYTITTVGSFCKNVSLSGTIIVTPSPTITNQPSTTPEIICLNGTFSTLTVSAMNAISYQWYKNITPSNTGGTIIAGANSSSYTPPSSTVGTTFYYCEVFGICNPSITSTVSGAFVVNGATNPPAITSTSNNVCINSTLQLNNAVAGGAWASDNTSVATINPTTGLVTGGLSAGTANITYTVTSACGTGVSPKFPITVLAPAQPGTIVGNAPVCSGNNSTTLTLNPSATGNITWQSSTDNINYVTIAGATGQTYTASNLTVPTYFQVIAGNGVCPDQKGRFVFVPVDSKPNAGTITTPSAVCAGNNSTTLTLTGSIGNIIWQASLDSINYATIAGQTATTLTQTNLTRTTYYQAVVSNGACSPEVTKAIISVNYPSKDTLHIDTAGNYSWHGTTYTNPGIYTFDTINRFGCDSLVTLYLNIVLPVKFVHVAAIYKANKVGINWQTGNELNTSRFLIQHSTDGVDFVTIGFLNARGSASNDYDFIDSTPVSGMNYYRIQGVDKYGTLTFSKVVFVNNEVGNFFTIYPNPAQSSAILSFPSTKKGNVFVYDLSGKMVLTQSLPSNSSTFRLNTKDLTNGLYLLKLSTEKGNFNEKLLIRK